MIVVDSDDGSSHACCHWLSAIVTIDVDGNEMLLSLLLSDVCYESCKVMLRRLATSAVRDR